jgi:tripartite-type tricarboxylate transporter receptor subunit TctC
MLRRSFLAAAAMPLCGTALGDPRFPVRPIKMVVPFAAGGGTDIMARLVATSMGSTLGQPVIVDNRAGAAGSIGSDQVAKAAADGYTILMATVSTHAINPALYPSLPYHPLRSFTPISLLARVGGIVAVNARSPFMSLADLAAAMRKSPGKYSFGSQGVGGFGHLMGEMFNSQAQVKSEHIPYKGAAPALQDLMAGNIDVIYDTLPALLPHLQSGALRALAVTTAERAPSLSQVPTSAQAGFPAFLASTWNALLAPANLPAEVQAQLTRAALLAIQDPGVRARMGDLSADPVGSSAAELSDFMRAELQRWAPVVKASGARME